MESNSYYAIRSFCWTDSCYWRYYSLNYWNWGAFAAYPLSSLCHASRICFKTNALNLGILQCPLVANPKMSRCVVFLRSLLPNENWRTGFNCGFRRILSQVGQGWNQDLRVEVECQWLHFCWVHLFASCFVLRWSSFQFDFPAGKISLGWVRRASLCSKFLIQLSAINCYFWTFDSHAECWE